MEPRTQYPLYLFILPHKATLPKKTTEESCPMPPQFPRREFIFSDQNEDSGVEGGDMALPVGKCSLHILRA